VFVPHEVDHIVAEKHDGLTVAENLALACALCNKRKGTDLTTIDPQTSLITPLFNPRKDRWEQHFRIETGTLIAMSPSARVTIKLLNLNDPQLVEIRRLLAGANGG